jgi:hypothetical protein
LCTTKVSVNFCCILYLVLKVSAFRAKDRVVQNLCITQSLTTERPRQSDFCASLYRNVQNMVSFSYTVADKFVLRYFRNY